MHVVTEPSSDAQPPGEDKSLPATASVALTELGLSPERLPRHVAMIMDGNGRWAQSRGWPRIEGHRRGVAAVRRVIEEAARLGLEQLTLYCFSSENWKRPEFEQRLLMQLLRQYLVEERARIQRQNLRFSVIGRREGLSNAVLEEIAATEKIAANNTGMRLCLAVNYGSRGEIVDAVQRLAAKLRDGTLTPEAIDEATISAALDTAGMPDPDLVIRTAGELRISNFLLWQISYAELWVTEKYWPDFQAADLQAALQDYSQRHRRFGGLPG